jgi:hypothetical protein
MTEQSEDSQTGITTKIELPCRAGDRSVPVVWIIRPSDYVKDEPAAAWWWTLEVTVPYPVGGHKTHTFILQMMCHAFDSMADSLQRFHDTRDVTIHTGLPSERDLESYIDFRAHDPNAEEISFSCVLRSNGYRGALPEGPLDWKLSEFDWYREEKEVLRDHFWIIGVHGLLLKRDDLPAIIAKLKGIPRPAT